MYKTMSSPRNIKMKSPIYTLSTITASGFISGAIGAVFISKVIYNLKNAAFNGIMIDESMFIDLTKYLVFFDMHVKAGEPHSSFLKLNCLHDQNAEGVFHGLLLVLGKFGFEV